MEVYNTIETLQNHISNAKLEGKTIGFVPSMGALHPGHISLVQQAKKVCDIVELG